MDRHCPHFRHDVYTCLWKKIKVIKKSNTIIEVMQMFRTVEERLRMLEQTVERQAFQIELLQNMTDQQHGLYQLILSSNMDRTCFLALRDMTRLYEDRVVSGQTIALHEYIASFERILQQYSVRLTSSHLADLIPAWLRGSNGSPGFSTILHEHFYN